MESSRNVCGRPGQSIKSVPQKFGTTVCSISLWCSQILWLTSLKIHSPWSKRWLQYSGSCLARPPCRCVEGLVDWLCTHSVFRFRTSQLSWPSSLLCGSQFQCDKYHSSQCPHPTDTHDPALSTGNVMDRVCVCCCVGWALLPSNGDVLWHWEVYRHRHILLLILPIMLCFRTYYAQHYGLCITPDSPTLEEGWTCWVLFNTKWVGHFSLSSKPFNSYLFEDVDLCNWNSVELLLCLIAHAVAQCKLWHHGPKLCPKSIPYSGIFS